MAALDIELLKEDISFPLRADDYGGYIWDADGNMVAQFCNEDCRNKATRTALIARLNAYTEKQFPASTGTDYTKNGVDLIVAGNRPFVLLRGWGRLQYKDESERRMNNVFCFLLNAFNSEL